MKYYILNYNDKPKMAVVDGASAEVKTLAEEIISDSSR
jgi:hypothetical protein